MKIYYWIFIFFILLHQGLWANDATRTFEQEQLGGSTWNEAQWERSRSGLQYTERPIEPRRWDTPEPPNIRAPKLNTNMDWASIGRFVLYGLAFAILVALIYRIVSGSWAISNRSLEKVDYESLEEIEENLEKANINPMLQKAVAQKDYRLALRLYFLACIQRLAALHLIEWKRDKTNGHYLQEMRSHSYYGRFANLTRIYEYVWYSDHEEQTEALYQKAAPDFEQFLQQLSTQKS
jgi:hypothetical protein